MKLAIAGGYGVGMTMQVHHAPAAGETVSGAELSIGHGGKGSNQAVAAARLGAEVALFTAIGADAAGDGARAFWNAEGVNADHVVVGDRATMTGFIVVDVSGENRITIAPGALDELDAGSVEPYRAWIRQAELLIVSLEIPLEAASAALRIAREEGVRTVLNPAPAIPLDDEIWSYVDILTPNHTEAMALLAGMNAMNSTAPIDPIEAARRLQARFGGSVILTAGAEGVSVTDGRDEFQMDAIPVERVVDTTGAGDAFTAALGVAVAEGRTLRDAVTFAAAAGAHAVTIAEVIPSLPTRHQLEESILSASTTKDVHFRD